MALGVLEVMADEAAEAGSPDAGAAAKAPAVAKPKDRSELAGTVCIYSPYINKNKTIQEVASVPTLLTSRASEIAAVGVCISHALEKDPVDTMASH